MSMWFSGMSDYRVRCNLEAMSIFLSLFLFSLQVFYHFFSLSTSNRTFGDSKRKSN